VSISDSGVLCAAALHSEGMHLALIGDDRACVPASPFTLSQDASARYFLRLSLHCDEQVRNGADGAPPIEYGRVMTRHGVGGTPFIDTDPGLKLSSSWFFAMIPSSHRLRTCDVHDAHLVSSKVSGQSRGKKCEIANSKQGFDLVIDTHLDSVLAIWLLLASVLYSLRVSKRY